MTPDHPDDLDPKLLELLLRAVKPMEPPARLRSRVLSQITPLSGAAGAVVTMRASDQGWVPFLPGVRVKSLYDDGTSRTWLARMEAGAVVPAHEHEMDEECFVLEGSIILDGVELHRGDHQVAKAGSRHDAVTTSTGCLVLMKTGSGDRCLAEMLA